MTPLQVCEAIIEKRLVDREARNFFSGLPNDERHYWIASVYALLMPKTRRRRLAAYFTPPHLAHYAIDALRRVIEAALIFVPSGASTSLRPPRLRIEIGTRTVTVRPSGLTITQPSGHPGVTPDVFEITVWSFFDADAKRI